MIKITGAGKLRSYPRQPDPLLTAITKATLIVGMFCLTFFGLVLGLAERM